MTEYKHPSAESVDKAVKEHDAPERPFVKLPPNLATNHTVVKAFHDHAAAFYQEHRDQSERAEYEENLTSADAMWRMSKKRKQTTQGSAKKDHDTLSNDSSSQFHKSIRLITRGQTAIIFPTGDDELPARYNSIADSSDYSPAEGERVAEGRNLYAHKVWGLNDWTQPLKNSVERTNKNGVEWFVVEWDYKTEKRVVKRPGYYTPGGEPKELGYEDELPANAKDGMGNPLARVYDDTGRPLSYVFIEKTVITRNCPTIDFPKARNVYCDLSIDDINAQQCVTVEFFPTFDDLFGQQLDGFYENVGHLSDAHLLSQEESDVKNDVDDNAGTSHGTHANGTYKAFKVWCKAPIVNWDDPKKAKFDPDAIPQLFEAVFVGPFGSMSDNDADPKDKNAGTLCMQLRKLPYHHNRFPIHKTHSHEDGERGALHLSYQTLLECNVEEQTITLRQHIDNKTLGIKSPWIAEKGNVLSRDLVFRGGNDVKWVQPGSGGTALTKLSVPDMTNSTLPFIDWLSKDADDLLGTVEAFRGVFAGARTTGTEYMGAKEQAMKPALEDAKRMASQYFLPIFNDLADLCDQFAPHWPLGNEMFADELYGKCETRIVSVAKYEADIAAQQVLVNFIQAGGYDRAKASGAISKMGDLYFWRMVGKHLKMPDYKMIFDGTNQYVEAENQAWSDVRAIMADPIAAVDNNDILPKQGEAHDVHLRILRQVLAKLEVLRPTLPPEKQELVPLQISALKFYIEAHEQLKEQETAQQQTQAQAATNQAQSIPGMPGEASGDTLSGLAGQATNL